MGQAWWHMSGIRALGRLRQEDPEFKASLDYIARPCFKVTTKAAAVWEREPLQL
jgi:hypothetical protein